MHETLRAVHVTSHIPFRDVPNALSIQNIKDTIHLAHEGLMKLGIARPRIGVAGLNPHAGDNGVLGKEEM
jgi:4-hydroxythreonine-4-phosphate dehydrogenase